MVGKKRRRPVFYFVAGFRDGAVMACLPDRKPAAKALKERGDRVDEDLVFRESHYGSKEPIRWEVEQRVRTSDILANRINTRRAIRELVLPELRLIQESLTKIEQRLDTIERQQSKARRE